MGCGKSTAARSDTNNNKSNSKQVNSEKAAGNKQSLVVVANGTIYTRTEKDDWNSNLKQEPEIEEIDVPNLLSGYHEPKEPENRKADIFNKDKMYAVDALARQTPDDLADSYERLISHLTSNCKTDVEKVRAIFIWMAYQDIDGADYSEVTGNDTPRGIMKLMKDRKASYSSFFALLCRQAEIECVVIDGWAKAAGYKVGDTDTDLKNLQNSWNAVYVAGGWRLVFPLWACVAVEGHSTGAYTKVESKGQAVREKEVKSSGVTIRQFNEYFFLTDPDEFIYIAFPEQARWQLLCRQWDFAKFADVPFIRPDYFKFKVDIRSKFSGRLKSKAGECHIELACGDPSNMSMTYELYYNHLESGHEIDANLQLNNYVLLNRAGNRWDFGIRFPEAGVYKCQIVGGKEYETWLCAFKITVDEAMEDCKPLPFNPGKVGYGPTMDTEMAGLKAVSHKTGIVKMFANKPVEFNFTLTRDIVVRTELLHATIAKEDLQKYCKMTQKYSNFSVQVSVPEDGEYALAFHAQQKNRCDYENVCNYLLTSEKKKKKREWDDPIEKQTGTNVAVLAKAKGTKHVGELEGEIEKFQKLVMEDNVKGELQAAQDALEYKKDQQCLTYAINRRNLQALEIAIKQGHKSRFNDKLSRLIEDAEELRNHIMHLIKVAHDILEMKQSTISELRSYKSPPNIIFDIMRSTFLMLGETSEQLEFQFVFD
ncbi:hillarin-like isoform X2 [Dreissena polymorpha]|uniref:hillarin-like isoform X2 n=1 Tax=Dreissena polymorpha TaxID=45954 RepID=UPI002263E433|nr:hillarin-like isoform X2 [Dreissena polymorpha]